VPRKPTIDSVRELSHSRLFRIEELDLTFSNGAKRTYERVTGNHTESVIITPLLDDDTIIMIREYSAAIEQYELTFPKGLIDDGEEILQAANRELQEETGYAADELRYIMPLSIAPGYIVHTTHMVIALQLIPSRKRGDEPEELELVPCRLSELDKIIANPDVTDARTIAALLYVAHNSPQTRGS
jgi:ADP-ribose diphosphatase